jgi:hypothetical protein
MAKIMKICAKCSDMFGATLEVDGQQMGETYSGYVPDFFPGMHYGDYVILDIDIESGKILKWETPSDEDLANLFKLDENE